MKNIILHQSYSSKYLDMIFSWFAPLNSISAKYFAVLSSSTYVGPRTMELLPNIFSLLYWSGELTENVPSHPSQNSVVPYNTVAVFTHREFAIFLGSLACTAPWLRVIGAEISFDRKKIRAQLRPCQLIRITKQYNSDKACGRLFSV